MHNSSSMMTACCRHLHICGTMVVQAKIDNSLESCHSSRCLHRTCKTSRSMATMPSTGYSPSMETSRVRLYCCGTTVVGSRYRPQLHSASSSAVPSASALGSPVCQEVSVGPRPPRTAASAISAASTATRATTPASVPTMQRRCRLVYVYL